MVWCHIIIFVLMKSAIFALLACSAAAVRINDADPFFNEPTWNERMASAGGFVQLSSCISANVDGVLCQPADNMLFATGMNGDEDLGEDIIMKGEPYHYNQKKLAQIRADPVSDEAEKVSVLQTPYAGTHTSFYAQQRRN